MTIGCEFQSAKINEEITKMIRTTAQFQQDEALIEIFCSAPADGNTGISG